jgi:uroporphyrinogen decarboxylase
MTSRELLIRTLNQEPVERAARDLWVAPQVESAAQDDVAEVNVRFASDIVRPDFVYPPGKRSKGKPQRDSAYCDAWGCIWHVAGPGERPQLQSPPLADAADVAQYQAPHEILEKANFDRVNSFCASTSRFVVGVTEVRPLLRLLCLRGHEAALADLAGDAPQVRDLLAVLHQFHCRELQLWAGTDVDAVLIHDDWGTAEGLRTAADVWRELFRPLYREYVKIVHGGDKFVFFQSAGNIASIFSDLVRLQVDTVRADFHLMNLTRLAQRYRGRITFSVGVDPRQVLAQGSPAAVREAVGELRRTLDFGAGGVIAHCRWDADVPFKNVIAYFEQWMAPMPMHAGQ